MENINKLSYLQYKINENTLNIPMEDIIQQYDDKQFAKKPYLFKILYIGKYNKKTNEYIVYLGPPKKSSLPIIKATIPLEKLQLYVIFAVSFETFILKDSLSVTFTKNVALKLKLYISP